MDNKLPCREQSMKHTYNFPVLQGIQAGREYYLALCPLKLISKLFLYDEEGVPADLRAQRILNKARIPEIASYIVENPTNYTFSAITASIGGEVEFQPINDSDEERNVGILSIPMDAPMIINDGQHRRAAIEEALKERPELADESLAVVFFVDAGLQRSQQMFADLNKHAVRPSQSLGVLYDHRDPLAELARHIMLEVPVFKELTEKERTTISNRSPKLFTLSSIYQATRAFLRKGKKDNVSEDECKLAIDFWINVSNAIPEWQLALKKQVSCASLRENFIHSHGVALQAIGMAGSELVSEYPNEWKERLNKLGTIDWARSRSNIWEGRATIQGRISKAWQQVLLTSIYIKKILGVPLISEEESMEEKFMGSKK
jgi:DNA sulfur modification protein DndB